MSRITLKEMTDVLTSILKDHPDLADKEVFVTTVTNQGATVRGPLYVGQYDKSTSEVMLCDYFTIPFPEVKK